MVLFASFPEMEEHVDRGRGKAWHRRDIKHAQSSAQSDQNVDARRRRIVRDCLQRVQEHRNQVLERARKARGSGVFKGNALSVQHDLGTIVRSTIRDHHQGCVESDSMTQDDYIELMQKMEQQLYEGGSEIENELDYLSGLETQEIQDMMQTHFPENSRDGNLHGVLCPLCRDAWLLEWNGVIMCPSGHLQIDASYEGIGLDGLEKRLDIVQKNHETSGCPGGALEFHQQGPDDPTLHSLIASCPTCQTYDVVL